MKTLICYSGKSSVTGKAIRQKFNALRKRTGKKAKCDLFIRWGSTEEFPNTRYKVELNSLEAVRNAVNKLKMLQLLSAAEVPTLDFGTELVTVNDFLDENGSQYIRNKLGVVRYANDFNPASDMYYSKPIVDKRREYRVHVFNGKILGIYEKVPMGEERPKLFKSDTCNFKRRDPELCLLNKENQEVCIKSVQALGLLFGGVDCIRDKNGNIFICEVNSSPSLNTLNVDRWSEEILNYVETNLAI